MIRNLLRDVHYAFRQLIHTALIGGGVAWFIVLILSPMLETLKGVDREPKLVVRQLGFKDGHIFQKIDVQNIRAQEAKWSAGIYGSGSTECLGSGEWTYTTKIEPVFMTLDQWTGDECFLVPGETYTARATWRWFVFTSDGERELRSITERFTLTYKETSS